MIVLALLILAGCTSNGSKGREKGVIDSLSTVFYDILGNDPDRALAFTDSLEGAGVWSLWPTAEGRRCIRRSISRECRKCMS